MYHKNHSGGVLWRACSKSLPDVREVKMRLIECPIEAWPMTRQDDGCWVWKGSLSNGYGILTDVNGKRVRLHRFLWERLNGPVPDGFQLDHLCRVRNCLNPDHLEVVTCRENVLRGIGPAAVNARKVICIHGHPFAGPNLRINKRGDRACRTCVAAESKRRRVAAHQKHPMCRNKAFHAPAQRTR